MDKNKMKWLGRGFTAALTLVLIFQNTQVVVVSLLLWRSELSLALLVFLVASVFFGVGYFLARWTGSNRRRMPS